MKYTKILIYALILMIVPLSFFFGIKFSEFNTSDVVASNQIALVNNDQTVEYEGEYYNYGNISVDLIMDDEKFSSYEFTATTSSEAEQGLESNKYSAMIIIPSNFSDATLSVEEYSPTKAQIIYQVNDNISMSKFQTVQNDTFNISNQITDNLTYLYVNSLFDQVHVSQNGIETIKENQEPVFEYTSLVEGTDLFTVHSYELGEVDSTENVAIDLNLYNDEYAAIVEDYGSEFKNKISVMESENAITQEGINNELSNLTSLNIESDEKFNSIEKITTNAFQTNENLVATDKVLNENTFQNLNSQNTKTIDMYYNINNLSNTSNNLVNNTKNNDQLTSEQGSNGLLFGQGDTDTVYVDYKQRDEYYEAANNYLNCSENNSSNPSCYSLKKTAVEKGNIYFENFESEYEYFNDRVVDGSNSGFSNSEIYSNMKYKFASEKNFEQTTSDSNKRYCNYIDIYNNEQTMYSTITSSHSYTKISKDCNGNLINDPQISSTLEDNASNLKNENPFTNENLENLDALISSKSGSSNPLDLKYGDANGLCASTSNILCDSFTLQDKLIDEENSTKAQIGNVFSAIIPNYDLTNDSNIVYDGTLLESDGKKIPNSIALILNGYNQCPNGTIVSNVTCEGGSEPINHSPAGNLYENQNEGILYLQTSTSTMSEYKVRVDEEPYNTRINENKTSSDEYVKDVESTNSNIYATKVEDYTDNQKVMTDYITTVRDDTTYEDITNGFVADEEDRQEENNKILYNIELLMPNSQFNGVENKLLYNKISTPNEIVSNIPSSQVGVNEEGKTSPLILLVILFSVIIFIAGMYCTLYWLEKRRNT